MDSFLIIIPAIKKNAVIPDQLIKNLNGISLIQRAIDVSKKLSQNVLIITDSQEISLIAERNHVDFYYDSKLRVDTQKIREDLKNIILKKGSSFEYFLLFRANTPLVDHIILKNAYDYFLAECQNRILISTKTTVKNIIISQNGRPLKVESSKITEELKAFQIFSKNLLTQDKAEYVSYNIPHEKAVEIENYQDWWVCEKLLRRKLIVFNVVASSQIGMGHIYRSLTIAHEINDHEIIFTCNEKYNMAVEKIASTDYKVISYKNQEEILDLKPDIVINDVLNTSGSFIQKLRENNIKVINFEDLGDGSAFTNYTINELYESPILDGPNYLWGSEYFFLRDEFNEATPNKFNEKVERILITFGGTDQNNLTLLTLKSIYPIISEKNIQVNIVCGTGYAFKKELEQYLENIPYKNISIVYGTEIISKIMENIQIAICSNGRTVYELADMNIPSIVISHHLRENGHSFSNLEKGFINLGVINGKTEKDIHRSFEKLVNDRDYRYLLFLNISKYSFRENKNKIIKLINSLL